MLHLCITKRAKGEFCESGCVRQNDALWNVYYIICIEQLPSKLQLWTIKSSLLKQILLEQLKRSFKIAPMRVPYTAHEYL